MGTLNQHHTELNRRLSQLEQEVNRVESNSSLTNQEKTALIAEKHRIILKPVRTMTFNKFCLKLHLKFSTFYKYFQVVFVLEQLHSITSVPPQTPHETWFQEKFGNPIKVALEKLKNPADPRKPMDSWHSFKAVHAKLQKVTFLDQLLLFLNIMFLMTYKYIGITFLKQKRACSSLKMETISPILANMKDTAITMPGVVSSSPGQMITITSIDNSIIVLPTKTKPKKLVFHGSDGNS